jgi:hypothetical protein
MGAKEHTYRVEWSDEDQSFIGTCLGYPSLSWIATTEEETLLGIYRIVQDVEEEIKNDN